MTDDKTDQDESRQENAIFYLDTSAINFLADNVRFFEGFDQIKTQLKFDLCLSPVGLWEILLNKDRARRDYLIYWAQFHCAPQLLKAPTEILIEYIGLGCPVSDRRAFLLDPFTRLEMGKTWTRINKKIEATIPVDVELLTNRTAPIRDLSKMLKRVVTNMCDGNKNEDPFHLAMQRALELLDYPRQPDPARERFYKISLILLFFIMCIGVEFERKPLLDFWSKQSQLDPLEKLDYLIENHTHLLVRGPIVEMAKMAEVQVTSDKPPGRGLIHDCFHTLYAYYADNFVTGDAQFADLKAALDHPAFEHIILTSQLEKIWSMAQKELAKK